MWVRKWLSDKKRERNGPYSTLLTELRTEDGRAFYNYTRLPRGLYDKVLLSALMASQTSLMMREMVFGATLKL
jgi:hypothetical protein